MGAGGAAETGWMMARKKKRKSASQPIRARFLVGTILATLAVLYGIALAAYLQDQNWQRPADELARQMGQISHLAARWSVDILGALGSVLLAVVLGALGVRSFAGRPLPGTDGPALRIAGGATLLAAALIALPIGEVSAERGLLAGAIGRGIVRGLATLFGNSGAIVVVFGGTLAFLAGLGIPIFAPLERLWPRLGEWWDTVQDAFYRLVDSAAEIFPREPATPKAKKSKKVTRLSAAQRAEPEAEEPHFEEEEAETEVRVVRPPKPKRRTKPEAPAASIEEIDDPDAEEWVGEGVDPIAIEPESPVRAHEPAKGVPDDPEEITSEVIDAVVSDAVPVVVLPSAGEPPPPPPVEVDPVAEDALTPLPEEEVVPYQKPPRDFLDEDEDGSDDDPVAQQALLDSAKVLERTLSDFGVRGKVTQVQPGPVITRYEIEPAAGQKVAPIANLSDDLALALKARSIRVVAPIPGKAAVGIEVPNAKPKIVRLGSLLETSEFQDEESPLNIALGRTISGESFCAALDKMPHVLVAGATGAGKSVCINTIITSIIYNAGPEDVRFLMIDPKMLELMSYAGLPHVIPPIVTQPKEAAKLLKWAVGEMEARYRTLAHVGVRNIGDYNRRQEKEGAGRMPYLVVIVDELADLMLSSQKSEIEDHIARLAQMARAVGIHLVVATQRPSVDVITGVIKANFPSRIAFQVPTRTDSRTILDSIGAEKLLGKGDMLYLGTGMSSPMRVHGSFVTTEETNDIVEWLKTRNPQKAVKDDDDAGPLSDRDNLYPREREDDLFEEAARILVQHQQGSISLLQRRLKVGYARAARLVDMMEEAGIVGEFTGSKAREILVPNVDELEKMFAASRSAPMSGK